MGVTPDLDPPEKSAFVIPVISAQAAFWPMVTGASGSADFQWHVVAEDWDGQRVEFTVPLVFVGVEANSGTGNAVAFDRFSMASLAMLYISPIYQARRTAQLQGQTVAYAESRKPGDTHLQTTSIVFGAEPDDTSHNLSPLDFEKANQPRGYPTIWSAAVRIPAAATLAGAGGTVNISIHDSYIQHGMDPGGNPAEAFAKLDPAGLLPLGFKPSQAGGLTTPNLSVSGLSRRFGPVGDIDNLAAGKFDPSKFFDSSALILGTIPLAKIIAQYTDEFAFLFAELGVPLP